MSLRPLIALSRRAPFPSSRACVCQPQSQCAKLLNLVAIQQGGSALRRLGRSESLQRSAVDSKVGDSELPVQAGDLESLSSPRALLHSLVTVSGGPSRAGGILHRGLQRTRQRRSVGTEAHRYPSRLITVNSVTCAVTVAVARPGVAVTVHVSRSLRNQIRDLGGRAERRRPGAKYSRFWGLAYRARFAAASRRAGPS
jgi:hypothetical protein